MARNLSPEMDDELFNEVYGKAYTGPPGSNANNAAEKEKTIKTSIADQSDEEDEPRDPNAVPTDFTSREAKVWEAKAKATERNWKKRKEEEMICKICGESGHFTQGCPSTLGSSRKAADIFERVPARDKHVRALFSEKVISEIEKDVGCKIKMDEKFLFVSGKDRLVLSKGVDAVHKVIQGSKGKSRSPTSSTKTRSRSRDQSPVGASHLRRSESQKYNSSPRDVSRVQARGFNQDKVNEDNVREDLLKLSRGPSQARAYGNEGAKDRPARSRSPLRPTFGGDSFSSSDGYNQITGMHKTNSWDMERQRIDSHSDRKFDLSSYPHTLEEAEMEFKREAMELGMIRDKEEDEEIYRHRECIRELRENYMKKLAIMRGMQTKHWEDFRQLDLQRRQLTHQNAYIQPSYSDYDLPPRNAQYPGSGLPMDQRGRYPYPSETYPASRPPNGYDEYQRQRQDDFEKSYCR